MTKTRAQIVLGIAPSTRGFGFAVLEGPDMLVDWGVTTLTGDKNARALRRIDKLVRLYTPDVIVLHDISVCRRVARIRELHQQIVALASENRIQVALLSPEAIRGVFFKDGKGTKQEIAEILAKRLPYELASRLPPKRKPWMTEDHRMDLFSAVTLVVVFSAKIS